MAKSYRFLFMGSAAGSGWPAPGRQQFDVNDSTANTEVITADGGSLDPITTIDGLKTYVCRLAGSYSNRSATNAGYTVNTNERAAMLGGNVNITSYTAFVFHTNPGDYNLRVALGSPSGGVTVHVFAIFEGTLLSTVLNGTSPSKYLPGMGVSKTTAIISPIDGTVWRTKAAGTAGTDAPNGLGNANQEYIDNNGVTWYRLNWPNGDQCKAAFFIHNTATTAANQVLDTSKTPVSTGTWGNHSATINCSGLHGPAFTVYRISALPLSTLEFTEIENPLQDVRLVNHELVVETNPTFYCLERQGFELFKIVQVTGPSNFSLLGAHAPYYEIVKIGLDYYLTSKSPVPDSMAGPLDLTIRQTNGNVTRDTTINGTLVATGKPQNDNFYEFMPSRQWMLEKPVWELYNDPTIRWDGTNNEPADVVATVNSFASLQAYFDTIKDSITPANTTKYEVLFEEGIYEGRGGLPDLDFGTGWVRFKPAPGHNPVWSMSLGWCVRRLEIVAGFTVLPDPAKMGGLNAFTLSDPSGGMAAGIKNGGRLASAVLDQFHAGAYYDPNISDSDWLFLPKGQNEWNFVAVKNSEFFCLKNTNIWHIRLGVSITNTRLAVVENCDVRKGRQDFLQYRPAGLGDETGIWADDSTNVIVDNCTVRDECDDALYSSTAHVDVVQQVRQVTENSWGPGKVAPPARDGIIYGGFVIPDTFPMKVYHVTINDNEGINLLGLTPPTGTVIGAEEVNGDVTVKFAGYIPPATSRIIVRNLNSYCDGPLRGSAVRQTGIDSNSDRGQFNYQSWFNCCIATPNQLGVGVSGPGEGWVSRCVMSPQGSLSTRADAKDTPLRPRVQLTGKAKIYSVANVCADASSDGGGAHPDGRKYEDRTTKIATFLTDPSSILNGPFYQLDAIDSPNHGLWHYPYINDTGNNSRDEFRTQLRSILRPLDSTVGFIQAEGGEPTPDDTTPDLFDLGANAIDVEPGSVNVSTGFDVQGINASTSIIVTGGFVRINNGPNITNGFVVNGDNVKAVVIAPNTFGATQEATVSIGGISDTYSATVRDANVITITPGGSDTLTKAEAATLFVVTDNVAEGFSDVMMTRYTNAELATAGLDLTLLSGDIPVLADLVLDTTALPQNAATDDVLAVITNKTADSTITVLSPNDGSIVVGGVNNDQLLKGATALSVGNLVIQLQETLGLASNSPHVSNINTYVFAPTLDSLEVPTTGTTPLGLDLSGVPGGNDIVVTAPDEASLVIKYLV